MRERIARQSTTTDKETNPPFDKDFSNLDTVTLALVLYYLLLPTRNKSRLNDDEEKHWSAPLSAYSSDLPPSLPTYS